MFLHLTAKLKFLKCFWPLKIKRPVLIIHRDKTYIGVKGLYSTGAISYAIIIRLLSFG